MEKEDIGKLIDSKKFCEEIRCFGDDKLKNLIKEIYFDGMRKGYEIAKFRLELLDGMPFGAADSFLEKNMENIRSILELCRKYESCEK